VRKDAHTEGLLRELAPQVLGVLVRRYRQFDACEDAVQEALMAATLQWPERSVPEYPRGWLITVASRRMTDQVRSEIARRRREETVAANEIPASIAAVHDEAKRAEDTDWPQILALYELLKRISDNPVVTLNRAVAVAMVRGPQAGLDLLETLDAGELLTSHHRLDAVRAHLLEMAGEFADARCCYRTAARHTTSLPEQRYLEARAARLAEYGHDSVPPA
jgi:predicted RNA polymerase sigma factor